MENAKSPETGFRRDEASHEEFDVLLLPEGTAIFSWNTSDIQDLARLLGVPEFDPPRWCG